MDVRIIFETTFENGTTKTHRLGCLSRPFRRTQPDGFGLLLEDAKTILGQLQNAILLDQIEEISEASRICPDCNRVRRIHDYRSRVLDTLFGRFQVKAPRIRRCACNAKSDVVLGGPLSPLAHFFPDRSTAELQRLQAELGARHSFREVARILETLLPCAKQVNTSVRHRLGKVSRDLCDSEQTEPLVPSGAKEAPALTVFLDGAHIRCRPEYQKRHLDVVVGKIEGHDSCRRFGLVQQAVLSPASQLRQDLRALGWDHGKAVTVISDGEPALPNLVRDAAGGNVRHILDWWHISMRIQHVENAVKGLLQISGFSGIPVLFKRPAETLRWYLWHGKVMTATTSLQWLMVDCARLNTDDRRVAEAAGRVQARCRDLYSYLANNMDSLTDYGRRHRTGLPISSSPGRGLRGRHRQHAHGKAPPYEMVTQGSPSRGRRPRCRSRWSANRRLPKSRVTSNDPHILPTPEVLSEHGAKAELDDQRSEGAPLPDTVRFLGELRPQQQRAFDALAAHDTGVLAATTAFGKTVVASALIGHRARNTLVLVHRRELLDQWVARLKTFLQIDPKQIGAIGGGKRKPTGVVDVALIGVMPQRAVTEIGKDFLALV